ncbi:MAG: FGGY-family carbohydrate kinase [Hespellia sp.]|nr:FGGY-family carbohydrate kinase [Hespellia sp.]
MNRYVMGIDVGTNETKGVLVDEQCRIMAMTAAAHEMENPSPQMFEQDAEEVWWKDVCNVSQLLLQESKVDKNQIEALGVSALGCDCVPVDENGNALCKAILYGIDSRAYEEIEWLNQYYGDEASKVFGHPICSSDIAPKILWIKNHRPDVYKKTYKFLTASSFLTAKLTGRYCIDKYLAEDFLPLYDLENNKADEKGCRLFCRPDQMAEILMATDVAGEITETAARLTGLAIGTKVLTGTGDSGTEAISTGVFMPGDMMIQLGSTCYFVCLADKRINDARIWPGTFIIPDTYAVCAGTNTAGTLTKWLKDSFYQEEVECENTGGIPAFQAMAQGIDKIPAGSEGLMMLPYFAGERTPVNDPFARGLYIGFHLNHRREHMYKAALEGIAYSIDQHVCIMEENGIEVTKIMAVGGGTKNESWLQIIADVTGKPVNTSKISVGAAYGDALMASLKAGFYKDWEALARVIEPKKTYVPNAEAARYYEGHKELFQKLYESNKTFMHTLSQES